MAKSSKSNKSKSKGERSPAQKAATKRLIAANKAAKKSRGASKVTPKAKAKIDRAPPRSIGARVSVLEGKVGELRRDVDDHTSLFGYMKTHSKGLFAPPSKGRR